MLRTDGRNWQTGNAGITGEPSTILATTVGGRTVITSNTTTDKQTYLRFGIGMIDTQNGPVSASTASTPRALKLDWRGCLTTLNMIAGEYLTLVEMPVFGYNANTPGGGFWSRLKVGKVGSDYHLYFCHSLADVADLGTVVQGTTFIHVTVWIMADKVHYSVNGSALNALTYTTEIATATAYPWSSVNVFFHGQKCIQAIDAMTVEVVEFDGEAVLGRSETNGHPDNAVLYIVQKSALAGLVTAGTALQVSVANGAFTQPTLADGDHLIVKVLGDNSGGTAVKVNAATGTVTKSNWSLS